MAASHQHDFSANCWRYSLRIFSRVLLFDRSRDRTQHNQSHYLAQVLGNRLSIPLTLGHKHCSSSFGLRIPLSRLDVEDIICTTFEDIPWKRALSAMTTCNLNFHGVWITFGGSHQFRNDRTYPGTTAARSCNFSPRYEDPAIMIAV